MGACNCNCHYSNLVNDLVSQGVSVPIQQYVAVLEQGAQTTAQLAGLLTASVNRTAALVNQVAIQQQANANLSALNADTVTDLKNAQLELDTLKRQGQS